MMPSFFLLQGEIGSLRQQLAGLKKDGSSGDTDTHQGIYSINTDTSECVKALSILG